VTRRLHLDHRYVEFIPKELEEGTLFISTRFKTASHLCCCGCGTKVVTPLNPAKWRLTDHGDSVSLTPSIGLGTFPCRSHYWLRKSQVDWYPPMTAAQTARAQRADEYASQVLTGERPAKPAAPPRTPSWWSRLLAFVRSLWS
jgi:hypothetical protein